MKKTACKDKKINKLKARIQELQRLLWITRASKKSAAKCECRGEKVVAFYVCTECGREFVETEAADE